ncbi:MAG: uroporphyrinogen decarboxylase family protein [Anaerolineae bacterium]|nr:uroporphyrinogen decarboxylase family protein [Anaerolineae bacterium]
MYRLFDLYKSRGVIINFHICGVVLPLVDLFMDLGVNILNPVQATAIDLDALRSATQNKMALMGGISSATIVKGPPEAVRREAAGRMWQLGCNGGYFYRPDQGMS